MELKRNLWVHLDIIQQIDIFNVTTNFVICDYHQKDVLFT